MESDTRMRVVYWGTYDIGKPRNRIMPRGLKENGIQVFECHADIWGGIEDKSQVSDKLNRVRLLFKWLMSYPLLLLRYLRLPKHDAVIIGYPGQIDVLVLWMFAKLRGVPIVWDAFMSLYNTVVEDRGLFSPRHPLARLLFALDSLACRAADLVVLDTYAHGKYFMETFGLSHEKVKRVFVGAETEVFRTKISKQDQNTKRPALAPFTVLFYGQFIPLHGIDTIVHAAKILEKSGQDMRWILIGKGQEATRIDEMIKEMSIKSIQRIPWVRYEKLIDYINEADICLGIFESSGKATRVIPNKVYQILAAGKPLVTADTPAIRELLDETQIVRLVAPGNPEALASAILHLRKALEELADTPANHYKLPEIGPVEVGKQLTDVLKAAKRRKHKKGIFQL